MGEHARAFARDKTIYDPRRRRPASARKPGALRNGAPSKDWMPPAAPDRIRRKLAGPNDGVRRIVKIVAVVLTDDCRREPPARAPRDGVHSADVIPHVFARQRDPGPASTSSSSMNWAICLSPRPARTRRPVCAPVDT